MNKSFVLTAVSSCLKHQWLVDHSRFHTTTPSTTATATIPTATTTNAAATATAATATTTTTTTTTTTATATLAAASASAYGVVVAVVTAVTTHRQLQRRKRHQQRSRTKRHSQRRNVPRPRHLFVVHHGPVVVVFMDWIAHCAFDVFPVPEEDVREERGQDGELPGKGREEEGTRCVGLSVTS